MQPTHHKVLFHSADKMEGIEDESVHLVVTSPPYPMIQMWDEIFSAQNPRIKDALDNNNGNEAFELMHRELDKVWSELYRVLIPGGIVCINIGDATRTIDKNFQLFPSHARIISAFQEIGFQNLPEIIWRKQTNAPNKFMGSGMLPPGAYVTLEHEFILLFRKGKKRQFKTEKEKERRRESAYFWEERNTWFSDVWDFKGIMQTLNDKNTRARSAAFPFELAYRLVNMFSVKGDLVLDPFLGTGTTMCASIVSGRNSIGIEISEEFGPLNEQNILNMTEFGNKYIKNRKEKHGLFINRRIAEKGVTKYFNAFLDAHIITSQEIGLKINLIDKIVKTDDNVFECFYSNI